MSNFEEKAIERIKKLEREVERLRVKESPDMSSFATASHDHPQYALQTLENTWTNTDYRYSNAHYKTHFDTSSPSDFTWSATPLNKSIYSNTWLVINTNSPSNILLYKALGTGKFVSSASTYFAIDSNSLHAGLRLDDGTDTNVLRFWLESTTGMAGCKLWCTSKIAGTETTIALSPIMCYGTPVSVRVYRQTSTGVLYYYVQREPLLRSTYTGRLTSLPNYTRASIYAVAPSSQSRNAYFDYFYVTEGTA